MPGTDDVIIGCALVVQVPGTDEVSVGCAFAVRWQVPGADDVSIGCAWALQQMLAWPGLRMPDLLPSPPQRNPHTNLRSLHHPMVGSNAATERSSWPHDLPEPPL